MGQKKTVHSVSHGRVTPGRRPIGKEEEDALGRRGGAKRRWREWLGGGGGAGGWTDGRDVFFWVQGWPPRLFRSCCSRVALVCCENRTSVRSVKS